MIKWTLSAVMILGLILAGCAEDPVISDPLPLAPTINSFEECIAAGNPAMESYPRQCRTADGFAFIEDIDEPVMPDVQYECTDEEKANLACTRDYRPVCGDNGETYANGCTACGSGEIDSHVPGECLEESLQSQCEMLEGTWVEDAQECEYISKESCESLGGTFNECGSACRNDPEAEICTMQCVPYCSFSKEHTCPEQLGEEVACTMQYDPVCGEDGKTYGNTCSACASGVETYVEGECDVLV